jgi:hypothetical protein
MAWAEGGFQPRVSNKHREKDRKGMWCGGEYVGSVAWLSEKGGTGAGSDIQKVKLEWCYNKSMHEVWDLPKESLSNLKGENQHNHRCSLERVFSQPPAYRTESLKWDGKKETTYKIITTVQGRIDEPNNWN